MFNAIGNNKMGTSKLVQIHLNFPTNINFQKIRHKNLVGFLILFRASINIFIIFGNVLMPQLNGKRLLFQLNKENKKKEKAARGFSAKVPSSPPVARHGCSDRALLHRPLRTSSPLSHFPGG